MHFSYARLLTNTPKKRREGLLIFNTDQDTSQMFYISRQELRKFIHLEIIVIIQKWKLEIEFSVANEMNDLMPKNDESFLSKTLQQRNSIHG